MIANFIHVHVYMYIVANCVVVNVSIFTLEAMWYNCVFICESIVRSYLTKVDFEEIGTCVYTELHGVHVHINVHNRPYVSYITILHIFTLCRGVSLHRVHMKPHLHLQSSLPDSTQPCSELSIYTTLYIASPRLSSSTKK